MMSAYRVEVPCWLDVYASSAAAVRVQASTDIGGGRSYVTGGLNANYQEWQVATAAGTFTLFALYYASTNTGKMQWSIDGVDVGALTDTYAASPASNNLFSATGLALTEGVHAIRCRANGKTGSDYYIQLQMFSLERTGA